MRTKKWIAFKANGAARLTAGKPNLDADEVAIELLVEIPNELFQRPLLSAHIKVEGTVPVLSSEQLVQMEDVLKTHAGMSIKIQSIE